MRKIYLRSRVRALLLQANSHFKLQSSIDSFLPKVITLLQVSEHFFLQLIKFSLICIFLFTIFKRTSLKKSSKF